MIVDPVMANPSFVVDTKKHRTYSIFEEQIARKPDHYPWAQDFINAMHEGHWTDKEFDFQSDIHDFKTILTAIERDIITKTLSAIGQIEIAVKKFWSKLGDNLPHPSLVDLGLVMANIEVIHNNAYERLLQVLGMEEIFEENLKLDIIAARVNYLRKYLHKYYKDSKKQYVYALILFTLFVENVSLFSQFYIIRWFGKCQNVLKDTNQQVKYTRLEENIHAQVGIRLVNEIRVEHPELFDEDLETRILHEAEQAFHAEAKIVDWMLGDFDRSQGDINSPATLNADIVKEYVKNRINESLVQIGYRKIFDIDPDKKKQFNWADVELLANGSTDFFWQRPVEYAKKNKVFSVADIFPDTVYKLPE